MDMELSLVKQYIADLALENYVLKLRLDQLQKMMPSAPALVDNPSLPSPSKE